MGCAVAIVLDVAFGARLASLAAEVSVWIVGSDTNDSDVARLRAEGRSITVLTPFVAEGARDQLQRALGDVIDHHGAHSPEPFERLLIYGAERGLVDSLPLVELGLRVEGAADDGALVLVR